MRSNLFFGLLSLLATATPSDASHFLSRATQFHGVALKHSAGLARDLRVALSGVLVAKTSSGSGSGNPYCIATWGNGSIPSTDGKHSNGSASSTGLPSTSSPSGKSSSTSHGVASATSSGKSAAPTASAAPSSPWNLIESHSGSSFFNGWSFDTGADPTNGPVNYVDQNTAQSQNLSGVNSAGNAYMRVDTTAVVQGARSSVRIITQNSWTGALVIMDSVHMPTGCGTWPAFWTNGPNWPAGGEIDIVEGVNLNTNNQATIHTNPGCTLASSNAASLGISGNVVGGTNCAAAESGNQGCGVQSNAGNSFGAPFNANGGGVFAMQWVDSGVSVYFFPRGSIPSDITNGTPLPQNWGTPMAMWASSSCTTSTYFYQHSAIFDTTLCGDWAGSAWTTPTSQGQSCAQITGASSCQAYVLNNGAAMSEAYWEVSSVKIYQT